MIPHGLNTVQTLTELIEVDLDRLLDLFRIRPRPRRRTVWSMKWHDDDDWSQKYNYSYISYIEKVGSYNYLPTITEITITFISIYCKCLLRNSNFLHSVIH